MKERFDMENQILRYTLRVDRELFQKFRYVANANGRSINKELGQCLRKRVTLYENKYGAIPLDSGKGTA